MSILSNPVRPGNFSSSNNYKLLTVAKNKVDFGAPAIQYIYEKNLERRLGIVLATETDARALSWGKMLEDRVFDKLSTAYTKTSTETDVHPEYDYWIGSKDGTREGVNRAVIDFKCPFTRKSYCALVLPYALGLRGMEAMYAIMDGFEFEGVEYPAHPDGAKYLYQLVSNGCINNIDYAELIPYMPYESELLEIYEMAKDNPSMGWMKHADIDAVPYIPDGGFFKNIYNIDFEIPKSEKEKLTEKIIKAGKLLIPRPLKQVA